MKPWVRTSPGYLGFVEFEKNKEPIFIRAEHVSAVSQKNLEEVRIEMSSGEAHCVKGAVLSVMKIITETVE